MVAKFVILTRYSLRLICVASRFPVEGEIIVSNCITDYNRLIEVKSYTGCLFVFAVLKGLYSFDESDIHCILSHITSACIESSNA